MDNNHALKSKTVLIAESLLFARIKRVPTTKNFNFKPFTTNLRIRYGYYEKKNNNNNYNNPQ